MGVGWRTWRSCYDSDVNANSAAAYHSGCDNKGGPTLLLVSNDYQGRTYLSGAYTTQALTTSGYNADSGAFFFYLQGWPDSSPIKIDSNSNGVHYGIYNGNSNYGPTYGGGHDLFQAHHPKW